MNTPPITKYTLELKAELLLFHNTGQVEHFRRFYDRWAAPLYLPPLSHDDEIVAIMLHKAICIAAGMTDIAPSHADWLTSRGYYPGYGVNPPASAL